MGPDATTQETRLSTHPADINHTTTSPSGPLQAPKTVLLATGEHMPQVGFCRSRGCQSRWREPKDATPGLWQTYLCSRKSHLGQLPGGCALHVYTGSWSAACSLADRFTYDSQPWLASCGAHHVKCTTRGDTSAAAWSLPCQCTRLSRHACQNDASHCRLHEHSLATHCSSSWCQLPQNACGRANTGATCLAGPLALLHRNSNAYQMPQTIQLARHIQHYGEKANLPLAWGTTSAT